MQTDFKPGVYKDNKNRIIKILNDEKGRYYVQVDLSIGIWYRDKRKLLRDFKRQSLTFVKA